MLQGLLHGISPWDGSVYAAVTAVIGLSAALAIALPAIRAASIAPIGALAQE